MCICIAKTLLYTYALACSRKNAIWEKLEIAEYMEMCEGTVLLKGEERQKKEVLDCCRKDNSTENRRKEGMN